MLSNKVCTSSQKKLFWTLHEELVQPEIWTVYGPSTLEDLFLERMVILEGTFDEVIA